MKEQWNKRYASEEYIYGETPNRFFEEEIKKLQTGKVLFPAEGEGRNAVHAARQGWDVTAFDISSEAKKKAQILAKKYSVKLDYRIADFTQFNSFNLLFDVIVLTFAHTPPKLRKANHKLALKWLKPGGTILLQAFSKEQLKNNSGGPPNIEMLFSREELEDDFKNLTSFTITENIIELDEGPGHQGKANVINLIGVS